MPVAVPDVHPNVANVYRRKVERLAAALNNPGERDGASAAIRGLIERIVLTPRIAWGETDAKLAGDLGTILEWTGAGDRRRQVGAQVPKLSVSAVAGACIGRSAQHARILGTSDVRVRPVLP